MKTFDVIAITMILVSFLIGIFLYPTMPEQMASHWGISGEADGYMTKVWGLFLFPIMLVFLYLMFKVIPAIDPLKENIKEFRRYFDGFILVVMVFLFYIYLMTLFWNMGYIFDFTYVIIPGIAFLFYYAGVLVENSKRNWFIGIRNPWTISSDKVWNKVHKKGGKMFKIVGILSLLGLFFIEYIIFFLLLPIFVAIGYLTILSYTEFQKEK